MPAQTPGVQICGCVQGHISSGFPGVRKPPEISSLVLVLFITTYSTYHFSNFNNRGVGVIHFYRLKLLLPGGGNPPKKA